MSKHPGEFSCSRNKNSFSYRACHQYCDNNLFARQIFSRQEIQVSYTAGFEEVPAIHVAIIVLNFASLGYIERADKERTSAHRASQSELQQRKPVL